MRYRILVCDDERNVRTYLRDLLTIEGYEVIEADSGKAALEAVRSSKPDLCILDLKLPDCSGTDLIPGMKAALPYLAILVITALGTVDNAVLSMKAGAYDFITKPFDVDTITLAVKRAVEYLSVTRENTVLRNLHRNRLYYEDFIGECQQVAAIKGLIPKLAYADVPVLITGETGTGKNVLAKQIHFSLSGTDSPLVYVNCSSIPASLFESELFGHEKGAFTGAAAQKKGRVESADGGTLLLDEITEIPYELQAKMLDFLQERSFYRVGGTEPVSVSLRIIALTNKDLPEEIKAGRFRKDLFYRLNVIHFEIPPLRMRGDDYRIICDYLLRSLRRKYNAPDVTISDGAMASIAAHPWPGNVRELKNALERAFICADGTTIESDALILEGSPKERDGASLERLMDEYEKEVIMRHLAFRKGNRTRSASDLGISLRTLQYKLEKHGIREV